MILSILWVWPKTPTAPTEMRFKRVTSGEGVAIYPNFSPDGTRLLYVETRDFGQGPQDEIIMYDMASGDAMELTRDFHQEVAAPSFSPDGLHIAFAAEDGTYLMGSLGGTPRRVADRGQPAWSPDGKRLAIARTVIHRPFYFSVTEGGIFVVDLQRGEQKEVFDGFGFQATWSPDGKRLAFFNEPHELVSVPVDSDGEVVVMTAEQSWSPIWLKDALYFLSSRDETMGVFTVSVDKEGRFKGEPRSLTKGISTDLWSLTISSDQQSMAYTAVRSSSNLWRFGLDDQARPTGAREMVTEGWEMFTQPHVSPDGRRIVFKGEGPEFGIWVSDIDGAKPLRVAKGNYHRPLWSPDGEYVVFVGVTDEVRHIWAVNPDGTNLRQLPDSEGLVWLHGWSVDGEGLYGFARDLEPRYLPLAGGALQKLEAPIKGYISSVSPDGLLFAAYDDYSLALVDSQSLEVRDLALLGEAPIFMSDSRRLVFAHESGIYGFDADSRERWQIVAPREIWEIGGTDLMALSRDDRWLVATYSRMDGQIWALEAGE
ncbi:MAG: hypothetical protein HN348_09780 [Proteobacteria bacterium]|nr:hypothetical protein [Pseudomonadota bacterium]